MLVPVQTQSCCHSELPSSLLVVEEVLEEVPEEVDLVEQVVVEVEEGAADAGLQLLLLLASLLLLGLVWYCQEPCCTGCFSGCCSCCSSGCNSCLSSSCCMLLWSSACLQAGPDHVGLET